MKEIFSRNFYLKIGFKNEFQGVKNKYAADNGIRFLDKSIFEAVSTQKSNPTALELM